MNYSRHAGACLAAVLFGLAPWHAHATEPLSDGLYAVIHTPMGDITAELFPDPPASELPKISN
jgi:hypothetical protein